LFALDFGQWGFQTPQKLINRAELLRHLDCLGRLIIPVGGTFLECFESKVFSR